MASVHFHPVIARWFEQKFGSPTEPQQRGWPAIESGAHTLIAAPTGSGKTLAAFLAALDQLFSEGLAGELKDELRVVYVSPLKALSNDIHKNLEEPLAGIREAFLAAEARSIDVRAAARTGDTLASKRQAMIRKPPHILVTTPESLYLLLTSASGRKLLGNVRTLVIDEIHALVGNRRGSHLAISMERLAALTGNRVQRIGLSATQKPIGEVARFLVGGCKAPEQAPGSAPDPSAAGQGAQAAPESLQAQCAIIDCGYAREMDVAIELPGSALEAVMSNEVWTEVYHKLADLIEAHQTTLVFVNTRRLAERVTRHLCELLGADKVASHHGSLSAKLRLEAEARLKRGELKALVATASLELGIDIGSIDLVCQLGPTRSIATLLQRVGRARHQCAGLPKGRLFPLSRDELVECAAMLRSVRAGELDCLEMPQKPLDVLAQQMVACAASEEWQEQALFDLMRAAYPYRNLTWQEFDQVLAMLAEGFSTKRGRRGALVHHDAINRRVRGRRGARLVALTSGGAIPDAGDYRVVLEPNETFIGTVNEDFAVESLAGDIFQLGNASWRILRINSGTVRVEDAHGHPPNIPFWLGEAPGRTAELSKAVSDLRVEFEKRLDPVPNGNSATGNGTPAAEPPAASPSAPLVMDWLTRQTGLSCPAARQLWDYFAHAHQVLGVIPSQRKLVLERFFDESGGMQLVMHSPFGIRINRAWGLALRKRFCRSFNFELQAAATDEAIVLSLGTQHSFPLDEVFRYLNSKTVRDLLIQALLDAPMFPVRWRWNATRALALPRQRGGRKVPAPLQRMESENLLAAVFPDQLACLENIVGDRQIPQHPLVFQTIEDCLNEAMDVDGLIALLRQIESGEVECIARDLPEPSLLAHEILNARPYAFLDNAPLEERRTQAVYTRRAGESSSDTRLGILDAAAIAKVIEEAWPQATNPDELHEALMLAGAMTELELPRVSAHAPAWLESLATQKRAGRLFRTPELSHSRATGAGLSPNGERTYSASRPFSSQAMEGKMPALICAAERLRPLEAIYPGSQLEPPLTPPPQERQRLWEREDALRELVRGRMEITGPTTAGALAEVFGIPSSEIEAALIGLETEGFILRGRFLSRNRGSAKDPGVSQGSETETNSIHPRAVARSEAVAGELEWCERRLLARIHRLTINRLRAEIQPVSLAEFQRFLVAWQRAEPARRAEGPEGLAAILQLLDGYEVPAAAWEPDVLALRIKDYSPQWLDQLCFTGRIGWGRLMPPQTPNGRHFAPIRSSPISIFSREQLRNWLSLSTAGRAGESSPDAAQVLEGLEQHGALFFNEIAQLKGLLPSRVEQALGELVTQGWVTADSFEGMRALLLPQEKRAPFGDPQRRRRHKTVTSLEFAGRWSLLRRPVKPASGANALERVASATATVQPTNLNRFGAVLQPDGLENAIEAFARTLLRRYGVVFRRLIERESLRVSWYELGRIYRRLEARGEIRGGYFVGGVSGEQFALPEAIGLLRWIRKEPARRELVVISGADPLNLAGILGPGRRVAAIGANRLLLRDGLPIAALEAGEIARLDPAPEEAGNLIERALRVATLPVNLRGYYG